ncbi:PhoX family phosphatase [Caenimonas sedimenti]|uniref:PhoX family phosphatase n=1 Tax=Caenimonas sedimenti TaxID=2596921 RepID=A0A562ZNJ6_9BURK|nr:PhoX family phosphatase [Caenimonas sedimenti]TWO69936.1 PhoX family phosphatase [Caenimonas sedimenti]
MSPTEPASGGRRGVLQAGAAGLLALLAPACAVPPNTATPDTALPGFAGVPPSSADTVVVPPGYRASVLLKWEDSLGIAGTGGAGQAVQAGMHHDGMHFFPLSADGSRGLLVLNHEYTDETLLHPDGMEPATVEKVRRSQFAMGVSVVEVALRRGEWELIRPSPYARRIHGTTPMRIAGPAAGHAWMRTAHDPSGASVLGTFQNCAMGVTPWGTYLTCEENFQGHFGAAPGSFRPDAAQRRYGLAADGSWLPWWQFDERFDLSKHPNEANRFGWVVEIDPMDPTSTPVKRTALGRKRQESATCTLTRDGRVAVYMGDDSRFESIYKFVTRDTVRPGGYAANRDLLDHGTLYAARFDGGGRGQWLALPATAEASIHARLAADAAGATPMDRPEWVAVHPTTGEVYVTLSNNTQRGDPGRPGVDAANPRARNAFGHIVRWREHGGDAGASAFEWDTYVLAGDPAVAGAGARYPSAHADAFGAPDGLHFDSGGLLWIQTDMSGSVMNKGDFTRLGNNQLLCANLATGRIRRFLTGPRGCEVTGCVLTPDRRTLFVNIQHPGETSDDGGTSRRGWPDGGIPRSATVVVRREDGGMIGT